MHRSDLADGEEKRALPALSALVVVCLLLHFLIDNAVSWGAERALYALFPKAAGRLAGREAIRQTALLAGGAAGLTIPFFLFGRAARPAGQKAFCFGRLSLRGTVQWLGLTAGAFAAARFACAALRDALFFMGVQFAGGTPPAGAAARAVYAVNVLLLAPVLEETAFRGVLLGTLRRWGDGFAVSAAAILFAAVHVTPLSWPNALLLGLLFGAAAVRTDSVAVPAAMHILNNLLALALTALQNASSALFFTGRAVFTALLLAAGIAALAFFLKTGGLFPAKEEPVDCKTALRAFFFTLPMGMLAVFLILTIREAVV